MIESGKKDELVKVSEKINVVCGDELESYLPTLKNPRIIIFNVPGEVNIENAEDAIISQNSELNLSKGDVTPKFVFEDRKKHKNLVIEVRSEIRKRLAGTKFKIGWHVCNTDDYLTVLRCYKCSKYNHRAQECKGELVCPHCSQNHRKSDCKANKEDHRCINCVNFNKYNNGAAIRENHSSLDRSCICYTIALKKLAEKIDY